MKRNAYFCTVRTKNGRIVAMELFRNMLLVALGGGLGSVGRYLVSKYIQGSFPWGTLTVNLLGSLLIGILVGMVAKGSLSPEMKLMLVTGFCGGFTTFSTFANESLSLLKTGNVLLMALYVGISVTAGILAAWLGMQLARSL